MAVNIRAAVLDSTLPCPCAMLIFLRARIMDILSRKALQVDLRDVILKLLVSTQSAKERKEVAETIECHQLRHRVMVDREQIVIVFLLVFFK